ncbi:hypothetical protein StoSoilB13_27710 (plasmid) [Arthrobacter sp. StoSoilB13]|nr:hypothetical protein StoSoilB13_27710 [Arthrobacter sp. StoSoilB13]
MGGVNYRADTSERGATKHGGHIHGHVLIDHHKGFAGYDGILGESRNTQVMVNAFT